jgi:hypothetical protein
VVATLRNHEHLLTFSRAAETAVPTKEMFMQIIRIAAAAALLAGAATLALAQTPAPNTTTKDSPSKAQPGAPDQGPGKQVPSNDPGVGSRPIGPPSTTTPAPAPNPTGVSQEKQKSEQNDPQVGGKKN